LYSETSSQLLLRSAPDTAVTARILRSFKPKRNRQLWVEDLPKVPKWRLEREADPPPYGWKLNQCATASHADANADGSLRASQSLVLTIHVSLADVSICCALLLGLVTCNSRPPFVRNAHQVLSRDDRGTTAIYSCKLGFHFPGGTKVRSAFCDDSSVWQGQVPDCERKYIKCASHLDDRELHEAWRWQVKVNYESLMRR